MKYRRIEERNGYKIITTVEDSGRYYSHIRYDNGVIGGNQSGSILGNGWKSLDEYFRNNPGFEVAK